jgi:hypothetical protein
MATAREVETFLTTLKEKIKFFDVVFRTREKNQQAMLDLGITPDQRLAYILNLKTENYYAGPKKDTFDSVRPDYYEFGITRKDIEVYIKISVGLPNASADCISFHPAEFPMTYPLKNNSK